MTENEKKASLGYHTPEEVKKLNSQFSEDLKNWQSDSVEIPAIQHWDKTQKYSTALPVLSVVNYSDFDKQVKLFDPFFSDNSIRITSVFTTISYEEVIRYLIKNEVKISAIYVELMISNSRKGPLIEEFGLTRLAVVQKHVTGASFTIPIAFDQDAYDKQEQKTIMLHEFEMTIKNMLHIEFKIPARAVIQFTFLLKKEVPGQ